MAFHPVSLAIRFVLELVALTCFAVYGWRTFDSPLRFVAVVALPVVAGALWGVFATEGDPSRSGKTVVPTPGPIRLVLELAILGGGAAALWWSGFTKTAVVLAVILVVYHLTAYDRIAWLLKH